MYLSKNVFNSLDMHAINKFLADSGGKCSKFSPHVYYIKNFIFLLE